MLLALLRRLLWLLRLFFWLLGSLLLLLKLLNRSVELGWLLPEEVVDLVVGLCYYLGGPRSASLFSSGGILLHLGVDQGG